MAGPSMADLEMFLMDVHGITTDSGIIYRVIDKPLFIQLQIISIITQTIFTVLLDDVWSICSTKAMVAHPSPLSSN